LPMFPNLNAPQQARVVEEVKQFVGVRAERGVFEPVS